jgi:hypothetical protein
MQGNGSALRIGTPTAGEPPSVVAAGTPQTVAFTTVPGHPSNVVDVAYRLDGGSLLVAHAVPVDPAVHPDSQSFVARLPALASGQRLEYRAELRRAGQLIDVAPAGGWKVMTAESRPRVDPASPPTAIPSPDMAAIPRFDYSLEFLGALSVRLRPEVLGHTPAGYQINFFVVEGEIRGPRMNGIVRPEGGDWMSIRPDGVGVVHIRITYEMADGGLVLERSGGVIYVGPDGYERVTRGVFVGVPNVYLTPDYITAEPRWNWLNPLQCYGLGHVVMEELRLECDIYVPHVRSTPPGV